MNKYSQLFTKNTNRRGENSKLLAQIGQAVTTDLEEVLVLAMTSPKDSVLKLAEINKEFHKVFMKVRWADGFKDKPEVRFELVDIQKSIDDMRYDLKTIATIYMNENKTNGS